MQTGNNRLYILDCSHREIQALSVGSSDAGEPVFLAAISLAMARFHQQLVAKLTDQVHRHETLHQRTVLIAPKGNNSHLGTCVSLFWKVPALRHQYFWRPCFNFADLQPHEK